MKNGELVVLDGECGRTSCMKPENGSGGVVLARNESRIDAALGLLLSSTTAAFLGCLWLVRSGLDDPLF